jgi:2-amino-4-hydroxy-6-hydroxymethyldihydropteridine diphosphokinase
MATAVLGLGSNLGDRLATLQRAIDALGARGVRATTCSRVWVTEPVGGPAGQPDYLNVVVRVDAGDRAPHEVLDIVHEVESELGRTREIRWGPRTIDIDILLWDRIVSDDPSVTIPHPRMLERAFVVFPLLDIDEDPRLPDGVRVVEVASPSGYARPFAPPLTTP